MSSGTNICKMTHDGKVGIGTDAPLVPLHIYDTSDVLKVSNSEITINRNILPETNDSVDIGSAERKIRDMYISDNSLWIGDDHKLAISGDGAMKFRKRKKSTLPKVLRDASGNDQAALDHINLLHGTLYQNVTELKLNHVLSYARTINPEYKTSDIFGDDTEDYDQDTAADAWQINNSKIYLGSGYTNIGIGTNDPDPNFKLHVDGNVHTDGTISANNLIVTGNIIQQYGPGTTESYLFLQTSAVFQNDDVYLYENRKTSITLQALGPDDQWQSFGGANKIAEQLQNCFTYFLKGNRRDGNIHIITLNNSQTNATADRKYYAMRISSTQMKVWGSYDTTYPLAYSSALTWDFTSGATIYKTF
jgi:hypothetical protein